MITTHPVSTDLQQSLPCSCGHLGARSSRTAPTLAPEACGAYVAHASRGRATQAICGSPRLRIQQQRRRPRAGRRAPSCSRASCTQSCRRLGPLPPTAVTRAHERRARLLDRSRERHLPVAAPTDDPASHEPSDQRDGRQCDRWQLAVGDLDAEELLHRDEASSGTYSQVAPTGTAAFTGPCWVSTCRRTHVGSGT